MFLPWKKWKPETWILCFLLSSSPPKLFLKKAILKFRKIPLETLVVDFCFSCITQTFISTYWIELYSMVSLEFWGSYFSKYLRLIAATKNSYQTCPRKNLLSKFSQYPQENTCVGVSFYWPSGLQFINKRLRHRSFPVNITKFLRRPTLKTSANGCFCVFLLFYLTSFSKFIQNHYFMFSRRYYVIYFA